ncbi:bifunctional UDP-N-acetylglucosamine diphosphorylase/glucosamine-1-phosphate N-acetyltransferase GlmU [Thiohalobacter thiocyanaticus]|uniref:bifunctional UDP-N-acetylglucosamine diphosphorylase/glucosamine-1-phosphate N-acetyltransferase GlmU n=1 Tax=Thiohalobacter thiocyanaticus TaxID=585455 RepID=UPI0015ADB5CD|nr:bifunctional UDP-N-acetylglucosamine diphosphorylase/glucosamine-1-phosphate N-acetyltransferase GlmU [Thiohalobacter thiocyanaticus]
MELHVIILAAGQGTRMRSALPKVLHPIAGRPMLGHVIETAGALGAAGIHVVYGHGGEQVRAAFAGRNDIQWAEQAEQLGTGHAVAQALPNVPDDARILILYGDVPLIGQDTLAALADAAGDDSLGLLTATLPDPTGYGRIVRDNHHCVTGIVEQKDASEAELQICEINTGFMAAPARPLKDWIGRLGNDNAQGEYYLTDVTGMAAREGVAINVVQPQYPEEILGVNNRLQLAELERAWQRRHAEALLLGGVTLLDPGRFDLRGRLQHGLDVSIDVNVVIEGEVRLEDNVRIGPNCVLRNVTIGAGTEVLANCVIEDAVIGAGARIGPFARIRPETRLADGVHVGNFVEVKKAEIGAGSKVNHLSYIGDTRMGAGVNIGAGTITCNYDGANKHLTVIEDEVFIGSDTQLVAPVTVGKGATIGAGTTLTRDAPAGELTLSRSKQQTREGWKRPVKKKD